MKNWSSYNICRYLQCLNQINSLLKFKHLKKIGLIFTICILSISGLMAQTRGGITTATPFLLIVPDARAGAMGDVGVSTSADASSLFHNPSKIAFSSREVMFGLNYSPWLRN